MDKEMLVPQDISGYLGCDAYSINCQAQHDKDKLGFPVVVIGTRVRIPKEGFISWAEGRNMDAILKVLETRFEQCCSSNTEYE